MQISNFDATHTTSVFANLCAILSEIMEKHNFHDNLEHLSIGRI